MYIMLCESVTSILLLFKICSNPPINKKRKEGPSPWTGKFFGRHNKAKSSMLFITRQTRSNERRGKNLGQLNKDLSTSNPWTSKYSTCLIQGRTNIQYVQHMDEKMRMSLNLSKRLVQPMDEEAHNKFIKTPKQSNIWTR